MPTLPEHVRRHAAACCAAAGVPCPTFADAAVAAALRESVAAALPRRLLALPDVRQRGNFDCGAAAAMSVARYFGVGPEDEADYVAALGTTREGGTSPAQLVAFLGGLGLAVSESHGMRLADLRDAWARGEPVLCPIQDYGSAADEAAGESGHWVAVVGLGLGFVFLQDPSADNALAGSGSGAAPGLVMVAAADWLAAWHDTDAAGAPFVRYGIAVGPPRLREGFDPSEPRDESGEWTGGGGGGSKPVRDDLTTRRKALSDKDTHNRIHGRTVATAHLADSALQGDAGYRRLERQVAGVISERGWSAHFIYRVDFPQADVYYRGEHRAVISAAEGGGFEIERGSVGYNRRAVLPPGASDADVRAALHKVMGLKRPPPLREGFDPAEARDADGKWSGGGGGKPAHLRPAPGWTHRAGDPEWPGYLAARVAPAAHEIDGLAGNDLESHLGALRGALRAGGDPAPALAELGTRTRGTFAAAADALEKHDPAAAARLRPLLARAAARLERRAAAAAPKALAARRAGDRKAYGRALARLYDAYEGALGDAMRRAGAASP